MELILTQNNKSSPDRASDELIDAIGRELNYLRCLSKNKDLLQLGTNLGAFEAVLIIIQAGEDGITVSKVLESLQTSFASQSAIIKRLRVLREFGLVSERVGTKRSSVRLFASKQLLDEFGDLLVAKRDDHNGL